MPVTARRIVYGRLREAAVRATEGLEILSHLKRGQQMPWHVRSTDASRRAASRLLADAVTRSGDFVGNLHLQSRDDRRALLPNNITGKTAVVASKGEAEARVLPRRERERDRRRKRVIRCTFIYLSCTRVHARAIVRAGTRVNWPYN